MEYTHHAFIIYAVNIMAADDQATQRATTWAAMALTQFSTNIPVLAPDGSMHPSLNKLADITQTTFSETFV